MRDDITFRPRGVTQKITNRCVNFSGVRDVAAEPILEIEGADMLWFPASSDEMFAQVSKVTTAITPTGNQDDGYALVAHEISAETIKATIEISAHAVNTFKLQNINFSSRPGFSAR